MSTTTNKYPFFDLSEIITEPEFAFRSYQPIKPVKTGNIIPDFNLQREYGHWQHFFNGAEIHGSIPFRSILSKPLVVVFYSHEWKSHGTYLLKRLNAIQNEIKAHQGNLLIITPEKDLQLEKIVWENSLSLNFYFDQDNEIAKQFRVYSEDDPAWNRFSGIDANVALLSTYVIDASRQIVFDDVNSDFSSTFSDDQLLSAVYHSSLSGNIKKSA